MLQPNNSPFSNFDRRNLFSRTRLSIPNGPGSRRDRSNTRTPSKGCMATGCWERGLYAIRINLAFASKCLVPLQLGELEWYAFDLHLRFHTQPSVF